MATIIPSLFYISPPPRSTFCCGITFVSEDVTEALMSYLYVLEQGAYVRKKGGHIEVARDGEVLDDRVISEIRCLVAFGGVQVRRTQCWPCSTRAAISPS